MVKYILLTRMFVNGRIHEAGETVDVPDDWTPPMRTVGQTAVKQANTVDVGSEPLAVKVEEPVEERPAPVEETAHRDPAAEPTHEEPPADLDARD